jgi:hypothetical protein
MTGAADDSFARYEEQEKRRKTLAAELRLSTKTQLFNRLQSAGIASITVTFDGEGDSGQIEEISAFTRDNKPTAVPADSMTLRTAKFDGSGADQRTARFQDVLEHLCYAMLEDYQDGWEINEGAYGEFVFDVATGQITLTFNARFTGVETSTHTF